MDKKEIYKTILCSLAFLLFVAVLVIVYIQAEKIKTKKFTEEIQRVLDQSGTLKVASPVLLKTPAQTSAAVFRLENKSGKNAGYACLVRITGICGPVPAVFVYDEQKDISFAGIAGLPDIPQKEMCGLTDMQIFYWISRLSLFMEDLEK